MISFEKYADQKGEIENTSQKKQAPVELAIAPAEVVIEAVVENKTDDSNDSNDRTMMLDLSTIDLNSVEPLIEDKTVEIAEDKNDRTMMLDMTKIDSMDLSDGVEAFVNEKPEYDQKIEDEADSYSVDSSGSGYENNIQSQVESPIGSFSSHGNKDLETMKNYLALREQDVALLTGQMRSSQERVHQLEAQMKMEKVRSNELLQVVQKQEQQIKNYDRDKQIEFEVLYAQVEDLNLQLRERMDKVRTIDAKLKITTDEVEKVKERVRVDIRRIRVREKELESQLEILKKDSTALLVARDEKILDLKRKLDLLEFNMELVQEQFGKERVSTEQLRHKLKEAASVMKRAGGLLDHEN